MAVRPALLGRSDIGLDRSHDFRRLLDDLVGDLAPINLNFTWEVESHANTITLDRGDANDAEWILRVADDDLLTFPPCDDQHRQLPSWASYATGDAPPP